MLSGLPEPAVSYDKARDLRDRACALMHRAIFAGLPTIAGDAAKTCAHFARVARVLEPLDGDLALLARIVAAQTLPPAEEAVGFEIVR